MTLNFHFIYCLAFGWKVNFFYKILKLAVEPLYIRKKKKNTKVFFGLLHLKRVIERNKKVTFEKNEKKRNQITDRCHATGNNNS